ncbi:hypothetical protein [Paenibacillus amylolyticus]|uniref:hypothetical protein n=1 Tax=Paenibacillus amylolyticus TaxID=1451 RepID=UPI0033977E6D
MNKYPKAAVLLLMTALISGCTVQGPLSRFAVPENQQTQSSTVSQPTTEDIPVVNGQDINSKEPPIQQSEEMIDEPSLTNLNEIGIEVATRLRNVNYRDTNPYTAPPEEYISPGMLSQLEKNADLQKRIAIAKKHIIEVRKLKVIESKIMVENTEASMELRGSEEGSELGKNFERGLFVALDFSKIGDGQWVVTDIIYSNF